MVEDLLRTHKLVLEDRRQARVPCSHPIMHWLIEHVTSLLTKCHVSGMDGKTGYERLHGEPSRECMPDFGETIYFYVPKKFRGKLDAI